MSESAVNKFDDEQGDEVDEVKHQFKSKAWIWTLNNYTDDQVRKIKDLDNYQYIVFGHETAPTTGTPHLQGFVYWNSRRSKKATYTDLCGATVRVKSVRSTFEQASKYCKGDYTTTRGKFKPLNIFFEKGELPADKNAKMKSSERFQNAIEEAERGDDISDPILKLQYYRPLKQIALESNLSRYSVQTQILDLYAWQASIVDICNGPINNRIVHWVYDAIGGRGKTELCKYLVSNYNAHMFFAGKHADMAYMYPMDPPRKVVCLDLTRDVEERVPYSFMENIKNGMIQSTKYDSHMKCFPSPHLFVFANFLPDTSKLSYDRWRIINLNENEQLGVNNHFNQ